MISLAAYLRDSGGEHQELSTEQQRQAIETWAAQNGCTISIWFVDAARPGSSTVGRDQFQAMMAHFRNHPSEDGLVMWKMSRFARDIDDAQFYKADLRRRGYKIVSLADNIPDGPEGRFFEAAIDWMNQRYLEDLSVDVIRGLHNLIERYGAVPGMAPLGMKRVPMNIGSRRSGGAHIVHRWEPDPEIAPVILQAFMMRAAGRSILEIHDALHLFKGTNSYTTFYTNKIYIGILARGGMEYRDYCAPIVPLEIWRTVQKICLNHSRRANLRDNPDGPNIHNPRRKNSNYILSGLARCGLCGGPLNGVTTAGKRSPHYERYVCTNGQRRRDCTAPGLPAKILEQAIINLTVQEMLDPASMFAAMQTINQQIEVDRQTVEWQRNELNSRLRGLRQRLGNVADAIAESGSNRTLTRKVAELEAEENDVWESLTVLDRKSQRKLLAMDMEQIQSASQEIRDILLGEDRGEIRSVLRGIIQRIIVYREGNNIWGEAIYGSPVELVGSSIDKDSGESTINLQQVTANMSTDVLSRDVYSHRHSFGASFTATMSRKRQP